MRLLAGSHESNAASYKDVQAGRNEQIAQHRDLVRVVVVELVPPGDVLTNQKCHFSQVGSLQGKLRRPRV